MDNQEGIDQVCILNYFDQTKIEGDINRQSKKRLPMPPVQESVKQCLKKRWYLKTA